MPTGDNKHSRRARAVDVIDESGGAKTFPTIGEASAHTGIVPMRVRAAIDDGTAIHRRGETKLWKFRWAQHTGEASAPAAIQKSAAPPAPIVTPVPASEPLDTTSAAAAVASLCRNGLVLFDIVITAGQIKIGRVEIAGSAGEVAGRA